MQGDTMSHEPSSSESQPQTQSQSQGGSSSSSSGPQTSSQSSTSSGSLTHSSADTIPTQDLASIPEELPPVWGRLWAVGKGFHCFDCVNDEYWFGRDRNCDYSFNTPSLVNTEYYQNYSKKHFRIMKVNDLPYIEDHSGNGTFLNGQLIGKGCKVPLVNKAELSLSFPHNKVFVFSNLTADDDETTNLPEEFKKKYVVSNKIGSGVCGEVKLAFEKSNYRKVALKVISRKQFPPTGALVSAAEREIRILKKIDHPCLIKTLDFFHSDDVYCIVLELMEGGDLFERVHRVKRLEEATTKLFFYQMLLAVKYLHANGIIHRDLKPENVLLASHAENCLIKITDFNQSKILEESSLMRTLCGTPTYLAPEVFTDAATVGYSQAVDCWSLGVLLFICLSGYPPFYTKEGENVKDQITKGQYLLVPSIWNNISDLAQDVVKKLLVVNPKERLTLDQALDHPWMQDESMRSTAQELMYPIKMMLPPTTTEQPTTSNKRPWEHEESISKRKKT
ncbi:serine/threonine-protein kinase Chk2 isoform X1 [Erpetoichthys calabaricus]|uniref:serine/threonine-protein kinase Chk2 isoform X1 n=2 Tax=Erpetoichthys calabaricus TaxID=27687 RepID=UPI002233F5BE|nr:serine/threonine-protein kinase Chk2 isoform X1 [Erpetoichthys calabaricus]